jgi:hypothetical protein
MLENKSHGAVLTFAPFTRKGNFDFSAKLNYVIMNTIVVFVFYNYYLLFQIEIGGIYLLMCFYYYFDIVCSCFCSFYCMCSFY